MLWKIFTFESLDPATIKLLQGDHEQHLIASLCMPDKMISECQRVFVLMSQRRTAVSSLTVHKMFDVGSVLNLQAQTPAMINKDKLVFTTQPNTGIQGI